MNTRIISNIKAVASTLSCYAKSLFPRNDESYAEKWNYVHDYPVRAGLAELAENWPYHGEVIAIARP